MADRAVRYDFIGRDVSASKTASQVEGRFSSLGSRLKSFGSFAARSLAVVGTGMAGLAAAGLTMGIKTAAGLEQAEVAFTTLLGSGEKARAFLDDLKSFAAKTPFELPGLIDNARLLLGVGVAAKDVIPTLQAFGDAAGALGINQERFNNIMLATSQAISAGKFQTEDLNQIVENGIPIWKLLAEATGKPIPMLRDMASEGKLLTKDVLPLLQQQMAKDYGGSMIKQSQTLAGLWSTFMDTINLGLAGAIKPFEEELKGGLTKAIELAGKAFEKLPDVISAVAERIKDLWSRFKSLRDSLTDWGIPGLISSIRSQLITEFGPGVGKIFDKALDLGTTLYQKARGWADDLINGLDAGIRGGDWTLLARVVGEKLGEVIIRLPPLLVSLAGRINWLQAGKDFARVAVPFAIGFASGLIGAVVEMFRKDFWGSLLAVLAIIPIGRVAGVLGSVFGKLPIAGPLLSAIQRAGAALEKPIGAVVAFIARNFTAGFAKHFPGVAASLKDKLLLFDTAVRSKAIDLAKAGLELIGGLIRGIGSGAGKVTSAALGIIAKLVTPFTAAGSWLLRRGGELVSGLLRGVSGTSVASTISSLIGRLTSPFAAAGNWLYNAGRAVVGGLISGLWSRFNDLWNTLQRFASTVRDFWPFSPAKVGPLAGRGNLVNAGRNMATQLAQGMTQGTRQVEAAAGRMAGAVAVGAAPVVSLPAVPSLAAGGGTIHVGQIVVQGTSDPEQTALKVREELLRLQARNGRTGLL